MTAVWQVVYFVLWLFFLLLLPIFYCSAPLEKITMRPLPSEGFSGFPSAPCP